MEKETIIPAVMFITVQKYFGKQFFFQLQKLKNINNHPYDIFLMIFF
jgi:hypothetical protein